MTRRDNTRETITAFLALVHGQGPATTQKLAQLREPLDQLAVTTHADPPDCDSDEVDVPPREYVAARQIVQARFPDLGFYRAQSLDLDEELTGDAVDDLADLVLDLESALWRWANVSPEDALWHYHLEFRTHWGEHLRALQTYLHERLVQ